MSKSFWQKNRLVTHILFDLCLFKHSNPVAVSTYKKWRAALFALIYAYFLVELERWYYDTNCLKLEKWQNKFGTNFTTPKLLSSCCKLCMRRSSKQVLFSFDTSKSISIRSKFWQITTQKTCRLLALLWQEFKILTQNWCIPIKAFLAENFKN